MFSMSSNYCFFFIQENMDDTEFSDLDESKEKYPKTKTDHDLVINFVEVLNILCNNCLFYHINYLCFVIVKGTYWRRQC